MVHSLSKTITAWILLLSASILSIQTQAHEVTASAVVNVPLSQAWRTLQDYSLAHNYVEGVVRTEITTEQKTGLGASRKVYFNETDYNNETIVDWQEGKGFTMRLHVDDEPLTPFTQASFRYHLTEQSSDSIKVTFGMSYQLPWGWFGEKLNQWVIQGEMEKAIVKVAAGFKHFYETGQPATDADRQRLLNGVVIER